MVSKKIIEQMKDFKQEWNKEYKRYYEDREYALCTDSGIEIKPVYTHEDIEETKIDQLTMPGVYPYTRGTYPLMYQSSMWTTQQGMGYGTPEKTRARYDLLRKEGLDAHEGMVPQFFIVPDAVVQEGYDPDHPSARGQVGIVGSNWSNMRDMETLFRDLPLDKTGVVFATYDTSLPTLAMYQVTAENMGFPARNLRGHTVANFYRQACWDLRSFPPENALGVIASRKDNAVMVKIRKRILLCKWALDAHDRGIKTVAKALVKLGYEVIFTRFEVPLEAIKTAEDEDVDVIGVSCSMGEHRFFAPEILRLLEDRKMKEIPLIFGGIIPPKEAKELFRLGVRAVFGPGTSLEEVGRKMGQILSDHVKTGNKQKSQGRGNQ